MILKIKSQIYESLPPSLREEEIFNQLISTNEDFVVEDFIAKTLVIKDSDKSTNFYEILSSLGVDFEKLTFIKIYSFINPAELDLLDSNEFIPFDFSIKLIGNENQLGKVSNFEMINLKDNLIEDFIIGAIYPKTTKSTIIKIFLGLKS